MARSPASGGFSPRIPGRWATLALFGLLGAVIVLVVANDRSAGQLATATLSAAPGGSDHPTLTVDPATDLVDHQVVTVHGDGFDPAASVSLWQCATEERDSCGVADFSEIDDDGSFTRTVGVVADDCRSSGSDCGIAVEAWDEADHEYHWLDGRAPLSFDPDAPLVVSTAVSASPLTGLADGDAIELEADGMRPGDSIGAIECSSPAPFDEACLGAPGLADAVDVHGHLRAVVRASPEIAGPHGTTDCRVDPCFLHVATEVGAPTVFALEFDPTAPRAPTPTASARLREGRTLEVQGEGFVPTEEVYATTCIKGDGPRQCRFPTTVHATAAEDGSVRLTYEPEPFDGFTGVQDCRGAECFVLVWGSALGGDRRESVRVPFALDP